MRVLVACEFSGVVAKAFRDRGHEAWSCDLEPSEMGDDWHFQGDVRNWINSPLWDLVIAFPPCTDLCASGAKHFAAKRADGRQAKSIEFFLMCANATAPRVAVENPIGIMSTQYRKPDQIIQPWQFGHGETKATCLWLKNLSKLSPTNIVEGREPRVHRMPPSAKRAKERSRTYVGVARAMAEQWG